MAKGGARNRSGPAPKPDSGRSERRGLKFTALPANGYDGDAPAWPLPRRAVYYTAPDERGKPARRFDESATQEVAERERQLWAWAWGTPQAWAWAQPSEAWRLMTVAMWVRTYVLCESDEATAADKGSLHRFADQIGMTPAGLKENGWAIAHDEVAEKAATRSEAKQAPTRRLRAVPVGDA